jgi:hypothetical protein
MKLYLLDYLNDDDRNSPNYLPVNKSLDKFIYLRCDDAQAVIDNLSQISSLEDTIIIILAHGGKMGITNQIDRLHYEDLSTSLDLCRGENKLIVNLMAICNSKNLLKNIPSLVDELWLSTSNVEKISYAIMAADIGFERFKSGLEDEEYNLYISQKLQ